MINVCTAGSYILNVGLTGEDSVVGLSVFLILLMIGGGTLLLVMARKRWVIQGLLRQPTVDGLLRFNDRAHNGFPEHEFIRATGRAMALAYYGHSMGSLNEVSGFDMSKHPPIYGIMQRSVGVLNNYLQRSDLQQSLQQAREDLGVVRATSRGAKVFSTTNTYEAFVEVGEVLNNVHDAQTIASLERRFKRSTVLLRPLVAWVLVIAYQRQGDMHRSEELKSWLQKTAPYCKVFQRID